MSSTARKRGRGSLKEKESDSEYEESSQEYEESEEEYIPSPPPKKRQRRSPRRRNTKKTERKEAEEDEEEDEEDEEDQDEEDQDEEEEDSDIENTNNSNSNNSNSNNKISSVWKSRMNKLQKENVALKKENASLKKEIKALKLKSNKASLPSINGKKHFNGFQKSLIRIAKLKKTRFHGYSSVITVEQILDFQDFKQLFDGKGNKIQPTPDNKPKSVKHIIMFDEWDDVKQLFNDYDITLNEEIEVSLWSQGSIFRGKSRYLRKEKANIESLTVEYNKSSRVLKLKFDASRGDIYESYRSGPFIFL